MPLFLCWRSGRLSRIVGWKNLKRPATSLFLNRGGVNEENPGRLKTGLVGARFGWLIFAEEFFAVFGEADEHDHGRARQPDKEHHFQYLHCEEGQMLHKKIVT